MTEDRRNLSFHTTRNVWYIKFVNHHQKFEVTAATLEEAIDLRDRVRDFIATHDRIPKFEEIGYVPRPRGPKPTPKQTYRYECSRCNRVTETQSKANYTNFVNADNICGMCRISDAIARNVSSDTPNKANKLGVRNISFDKRSNRYNVSVARHGEMFSCAAKTLEEAISIKKSVLEFIDSNGRVPTNTEGAEMFGYTARNRSDLSKSSKSHSSSTSERHIAKDRCKDVYVVQISRAGRKFSMRIKNLEHAKILRNEVYDYYRSHDMLPKTEEFLERRNRLNDEID
jgi:hypothetical protein